MKLFYLLLMFIWIIVISENPGKAQSLKDTIKLESVLISGKRIVKNFNETRSEIDSISLVKSSTVRLSELISQNSPIYIKEYGRGAMATASFRGTAPSHTKVSWNGLDLNSPMLGMVDFSLIPVYFTDEVKLLHGASSLSESSGALGGTILLENTPNWNNILSGKLLSGFGSYRTFDEYLQINAGSRKIQSKSSFFYNCSANDFSFTNKLNASINPVSGDYFYPSEKNRNAGYKNYGFLQEFYLQISSNQTFSLKTWLQHNNRSIPTLLTNESDPSSNINRQTENALRSVAEWRRFGVLSRLTAMSAINLQNSVYKLENSVSGAPNQVVTDANATTLSFTNKLGFRYQFSRYITVIAGIEANFYQVVSENRIPSLQINGYYKNRIENSVFAELETKLSPNWDALLLFREELISLNHQALLPLFRISYQPNQDTPLKITASVAANSHPPTLNDLYYIPGGNPDLKAENSLQSELGVVDEFHFEKSHLHAGISIFHSAVKNWIIWLPTFQGYWEPTNIDKVGSAGIEANVGWNGVYRSVRFDLKGNYALTSTENLTEKSPAYGKQIPYIPKHSANLNIHLGWTRLTFDWMWNYYSKRYTTTANNEETMSDYLYPYFMNNLQIGIVFPFGTNKLTAECKVMNVFNENYRTVLQRPMPGRNYQFILHYDF